MSATVQHGVVCSIKAKTQLLGYDFTIFVIYSMVSEISNDYYDNVSK